MSGDSRIDGVSSIQVRSDFYSDPSGKIVDGIRVTFHLDAFAEDHEIKLPAMKPEDVRKAIMKVVEDRWEIAGFGG